MCRFHARANKGIEVTFWSALVLNGRYGRDSARPIGAQPGSAKAHGGDKSTAGEVGGRPEAPLFSFTLASRCVSFCKTAHWYLPEMAVYGQVPAKRPTTSWTDAFERQFTFEP